MRKNIILVLIVACAIIIGGCANRGILTGSVKVKLVDAFSGNIIPDADVKIYSDNGVRCFTTPCNTEGQEWNGKSDGDGIVIVPKKVINEVTTITATGYGSGRDLNRYADKITDSEWTIELDPDYKTDNFEKRLKLVDSISGEPLRDVSVWMTNNVSCHPPECSDYIFSGTTNALGNFYYHPSVIRDNNWIYVDGYKPAIYRSGGANRTISLDKEKN